MAVRTEQRLGKRAQRKEQLTMLEQKVKSWTEDGFITNTPPDQLWMPTNPAGDPENQGSGQKQRDRAQREREGRYREGGEETGKTREMKLNEPHTHEIATDTHTTYADTSQVARWKDAHECVCPEWIDCVVLQMHCLA